MPTIIDAETFFERQRPQCVPADAPVPDFQALVARVAALDASKHPLAALKSILEREHFRLGAGAEALRAIGSIGADTVFVAAGQQAGLFGGPLYTVYKAMHAVRLAARLTEETGRGVVPVFWIASDDHDFSEVNALDVRNSDGEPFRLEYTPVVTSEGAPVGDIILDSGIAQAIDTLAGTMPSGDAAASYLDMVRRAWIPGRPWADAFAVHMLGLFGRHGLVMLDPRWTGVKALFSRIYAAELANPLATARLVNDEADAFESASLRKKALRKPEGSTNLFLETDGVRHPLMYDGERFVAGDAVFFADEMREFAVSAPERLSPAAALRPVCQDSLMPVAALIAGPGERLYLSQLDTVYDLFGVSRSVPWPRASFTIIDRRTIRAAEREGVPLPVLFSDYDRLKSDIARGTFPEEAGRALDDLDRTVTEAFGRVAESIAAIDPTLRDAVRKDLGRVLHIAEGIRGRALKAHKATLDISGRRLASAAGFLRPGNSPQERRYGFDAVSAALDRDTFDTLIEVASPGEENHRIVIEE